MHLSQNVYEKILLMLRCSQGIVLDICCEGKHCCSVANLQQFSNTLQSNSRENGCTQ